MAVRKDIIITSELTTPISVYGVNNDHKLQAFSVS
jgi:hypothetical protein